MLAPYASTLNNGMHLASLGTGLQDNRIDADNSAFNLWANVKSVLSAVGALLL